MSFDDISWLAELSVSRSSSRVCSAVTTRGGASTGAAAVVVSNHGGRQLDRAVSGAAALPEVVEAVAGQVEVYVDGGVRRGTDVLKAPALGARAVLVGRPVSWGLATGGAAGVQTVLDGLRYELQLAMSLCGCATVGDVGTDVVARS